MEMKDLIGLSKPLTKLVEVVSSGIGRLSRAHFAKRDSDAKAYEIKRIAEAFSESRKLLGEATYSSDGLTISAPAQAEIQSQELFSYGPPPEDRTLARVSYQEVKKQINTENIIQHAAEELRDKETVSDEKVDEDWISRFFDIGGNVSSEDMQILWGKVLAGEVMKPGSYSLRTLEALKNFSKEEAEVFAKVAQAAIRAADDSFFIPELKDDYLKSEFGITFGDMMLLRTIGIITPTNISFTYGVVDKQGVFHFHSGGECSSCQ